MQTVTVWCVSVIFVEVIRLQPSNDSENADVPYEAVARLCDNKITTIGMSEGACYRLIGWGGIQQSHSSDKKDQRIFLRSFFSARNLLPVNEKTHVLRRGFFRRLEVSQAF